MIVTNHIPIIAVFGSGNKDHEEIAKSVGAELAMQKCIVLTGSGPISGEAVKDWAIKGAKTKDGCWINVENDTEENARWEAKGLTPENCVIQSHIGHKRNYLEACLCDAAIAIEGGPGTISEATFCLSLNKPVVFVGQKWVTDFHKNGWNQLISGCTKAMNRETVVSSPFDSIFPTIEGKLITLNRLLLAWLPANINDVSLIVRHAIDLCRLSVSKGVIGRFPILDPTQAPTNYAKAEKDYEEWLIKARTKLATQQ